MLGARRSSPHPPCAGCTATSNYRGVGQMIPDDPELRHALAARSSEATPEFRARMHAVLAAGRPTTNWMPALALITVFVVSFASVGVLIAARNLTRPPQRGLVSPSLTASPSPLPSESPVELPT